MFPIWRGEEVEGEPDLMFSHLFRPNGTLNSLSLSLLGPLVK